MSQARRMRAAKVAAERIFTLCCVYAVGGYFMYHAATGDHGFFANMKYKAEEQELLAELAELREQRDDLEARVALLRPESLDPDMLDQRAREIINLAHPRDIVIPVKRD